VYVPDYEAVLAAIGTTREVAEATGRVSLPVPLLHLLLQGAVVQGYFDGDGYLAANPDVAEAVRAGTFPDARAHYVLFGYLEGRLGATPEVDEAWYLARYPDAAEAVSTGAVASATEHFLVTGAAAGHSPSAFFEMDAAHWKRALGLG
jgi:hypothetical protein